MLIRCALLAWLFWGATSCMVLARFFKLRIPKSWDKRMTILQLCMLGVVIFCAVVVLYKSSFVNVITPSGRTAYRVAVMPYTYHFSDGSTAVLTPSRPFPPSHFVVNDRNSGCELETVRYGLPSDGATVGIPAYSVQEFDFQIDYWGNDSPPDSITVSKPAYSAVKHWLRY